VSPRWLLRRTARRLGRRKLAFAGLALAFAALAALGAGARTLARESVATTARLSHEAHVIAYLKDDVAPTEVRAMAAAFARLPSVATVREVDGRGALAELERELRALGESPALVADVEADFLPTSLEIVLAPGPDLPRRAADVALRLKRLPEVANVDAMASGLAKLAGFETLALRLAGLLGAAAVLVALALCAAVIGRERGRLREEAEALALVGIPTAAARVPAGLVGLLAALAGGLLGLLAGSRLVVLVFVGGAGGGLPRGELLLGLAVLATAGLVVGCLSVPARRMADAAAA
jgi:cell division protein FtsX